MLQTRRDRQSTIDTLVQGQQPGWSLEQPFYVAPDIFELDIERVFMRRWLYAGHVSRIPHTGDYFLYEIAGESIIIVRGANEQIHALFNVCRHRGSRICLEEQGHVRKLVCPYHAWVYDTDGALLAVTHMPEDFDKRQFGLHRAHVQVVEGLIFVCFAQDPASFEVEARDISAYMRPHALERARICRRINHVVEANWKLVAENFYECYHCTHTHPEFCTVMSYAHAAGSERLAREQAEFVEEWETFAANLGHHTGHVELRDGSLHVCDRLPIRRGYVTQSQDGRPVAPLMGDFKQYDGGVTAIMLYPLIWFDACNDHAMLARFTPIGPTQTEAELTWLVRDDAVEGIDYDPDRVAWLWSVTAEEDWTICENNQRGVNSRRYQPGPYSETETSVKALIDWYLQQLTAGASA